MGPRSSSLGTCRALSLRRDTRSLARSLAGSCTGGHWQGCQPRISLKRCNKGFETPFCPGPRKVSLQQIAQGSDVESASPETSATHSSPSPFSRVLRIDRQAACEPPVFSCWVYPEVYGGHLFEDIKRVRSAADQQLASTTAHFSGDINHFSYQWARQALGSSSTA